MRRAGARRDDRCARSDTGKPDSRLCSRRGTADPGQIGIEIAGEAAVGAASFCVEEDAAEEAPAEEVTEPEGTQNDEMEEESGSEGKEDETVPEEPEPQEPDGGENAGMTEPGKTGETEPEGPENPEPGEAGETEPEEPENPEPGDQGDMPETPGNSEMDGPWPGEGEDIFNDPWPGQEEIGGGDGEQMEPPEEENGSAGSDDAAGGDKTAEVSSDSDLSQSAEPPAAEAEPVFSAEQEAERTRESYSEWQAAEAEKVTISRMPWLFHTVEKTYAIADVNSWLHVREGKGTNQKIVGILPKGSLCYILADADSDWVYVESGDVRGFVCARYLLRGEEAEKEVNRWQEESFPMAEMWVKPWNNKAYTYTYATTRTLLSSDEARGEVLQYAKKFLGNPYVWGGTSLTNGCDCSGFAQQIFANFGYILPRTSRQQAKAGTRIPVQEAKPGDLLFYQRESGFIYHVMIYLGDGKVIHAGSEATGILISDFNYEKSTEFAVRVISEEIRESKIETGDVDNGRKEGNSVDNQTTENGNGGKQKAGAENVQNTSAENSTAGDRLESASGKYLGNFKLTAYCNCAVCCGRWAGGPTASGKMPVQGRTIATGVLPFGTKLNIGGKIYTVEDRGTPYGHIDIYMERHADAEEFGVRYADVYQSEEI